MALVLQEELKNGAVKITLNDPDNLNAMSEEMAAEFSDIMRLLKKREAPIRALILTGAGRAFSAGGNLSMLKKKTEINPHENKRLMLNFYNAFLSILDLPCPLIAAVNGHAIGAGLCLAAACDIRICSTQAKLGFTFTKLGLHPGMAATYFLPKIVGAARAAELLYTGRIVEAEEALRIGLVSQTVETSKLEAEYLKLLGQICECGPRANALLSESLRREDKEKLKDFLEREAICQADSYAGAEFKEGVEAAINKRKPKFGLA